MARILFLEDRHQTRTWEIAASALRSLGHEVSWIVFNHGFAPSGSHVRLLRYPGRRDLQAPGGRFADIISSDRQINHFGQTADHYAHYDREIRNAFEEIRPQLIIGESTQFYELLTIQVARELRIPYIVPATARYPTGRFLLYRYDTLEVVGGSGDVPDTEQLRALIDGISRRAVVPDYMKELAGGRKAISPWARRRDWAYKSWQYLRGERFSSPAPWMKLRVQAKVRHHLEAWNRAAHAAPRPMAGEKKLRVLFPLHMQPEASVDVWGRPYNNQAALVQQLGQVVGETGVLFVKPNPKPHCELSDALLAVVSDPRTGVVPLASSVTMQDAFANADLIVTVTGTVAIEAIFSRKPCATLIRTRNNDLAGCRFLQSPNELPELLHELRSGTFPMHSEEDLLEFAARLYAESYPGIVLDPFSTPAAASERNRRDLAEAFTRLVPEILEQRDLIAPLATA